MEDGAGCVSLSAVFVCVKLWMLMCVYVCTGTVLSKCRVRAYINPRQRYTVVSEWA